MKTSAKISAILSKSELGNARVRDGITSDPEIRVAFEEAYELLPKIRAQDPEAVNNGIIAIMPFLTKMADKNAAWFRSHNDDGIVDFDETASFGIAEETALSLFRGDLPRSITSPDALARYFCTAIRHDLINEHDKLRALRRAHNRASSKDVPSTNRFFSDETTTPAKLESVFILLQKILSPDTYTMFRMHIEDPDLTYGEIGKKMGGKTEDAVRMSLKRANEILHEHRPVLAEIQDILVGAIDDRSNNTARSF